MELERGVPTLLERPEVKHEVWLEPGMLRGEGAREERCWRIRLRFFTVWKTRFGCSLQTHKHGVDGWLLDYYKWLTSESDHTVEEKKKKKGYVPLLFYVWIIHLEFLPHGALYFCCQWVLEKKQIATWELKMLWCRQTVSLLTTYISFAL